MVEEDALREEEVGIVKGWLSKARSVQLIIASRRDAPGQPSSMSSRGSLAAHPSEPAPARCQRLALRSFMDGGW